MDYKIGSWNVRSLYRPGALTELKSQLLKMNLDITAVQETRWTGFGKQSGKDFDIFYSGSQDRHEFGTAFIVSKRLRKSVLDFQQINNRLCMLRVHGKKFNITLINVHAPTEEKEEDEKDLFYEDLERAIAATPSFDMKIVLGDFNAQVGKEPVFSPTIGKHSLHLKTNENGERMIGFAVTRSLVVMSTIFTHKEKHKETWISPNGVATQIDHVLVSSKHFNVVKDVRSYRGPDINSDHFLVVTKINHAYKIRMLERNKLQLSWERGKLKEEEVRYAFMRDIERSVGNIPAVIGGRDVNEEWECLRKSISDAADQHCKRDGSRKSNNVWFDLECEEAVNMRNEKRKKLNKDTRQTRKEYQEARSNAKKVLRQKKRYALQANLRKMEQHSRSNEARKFFGEVSKVKSGFVNSCPMIKRADGKMVFLDQDVQGRWKEYFQELLNPREDEEYPDVEFPENENDVSPPDSEEVSLILDNFKNNKAAGTDGIPAEFLKNSGPALTEEMTHLMVSIWETEKMPDSWKESAIIPLFKKKGVSTDCKNYRGISLLNTSYKILSAILYNRIMEFVEPRIGDYQGGFRRNRSTIDQIFSVRQIMEKTKEFNKIIWFLFIDFKAAYDSIIRKELYLAMEEIGIPPKLIRLVACTLGGSMSRVKLNGKLGQPFAVNAGVRQGDPFSLFCLTLSYKQL